MLRSAHADRSSSSLLSSRYPASIGLISPSSSESVSTAGVAASIQTSDNGCCLENSSSSGNSPTAGMAVLGPDIRGDAGIRKLASSLTKLPLGENGRMRVRRMIGQEMRKHPELRPIVRSMGKLKSASNSSLIEMCILTNTLDEARMISREYLARKVGRPNKRASSVVALASPYSRTTEAENCGLTLIERLFADTLSHGACEEAAEDLCSSSSSSPLNDESSTATTGCTTAASTTTDSSVSCGTSIVLLPEDSFHHGVDQSSLSRLSSSYTPLVSVDNSDIPSSTELLSTNGSSSSGDNNNIEDLPHPIAPTELNPYQDRQKQKLKPGSDQPASPP